MFRSNNNNNTMMNNNRTAAMIILLSLCVSSVLAFVPPAAHRGNTVRQVFVDRAATRPLSDTAAAAVLERVPDDQAIVPIPFIDNDGSSFIECYCDSVAKVDGMEYTIGVPCDYAVALCYFDENHMLIPVELDEELMDDVFPVAERIVEEEFGEELQLQRTPQTLTLVGELEEEFDDEEDDEDEEDFGGDEDDDEPGDEEVEVLMSFEHRDIEFNLVRLLDPVLLVAKTKDDDASKRYLLTPKESDTIMPLLENMFLDFHAAEDPAA